MTTFRQIEANRRNALKSTGPTTLSGKSRSRRNAIRHGLCAETVITAIEDIEDYQSFEKAVVADYDAITAVERELVLRLASLLWRLRRATSIETGLLQAHAESLLEPNPISQLSPIGDDVALETTRRPQHLSGDLQVLSEDRGRDIFRSRVTGNIRSPTLVILTTYFDEPSEPAGVFRLVDSSLFGDHRRRRRPSWMTGGRVGLW
jgi:hypothetical protein